MFVEPLVFNYALCFGEGTKKYEDLLPDLKVLQEREKMRNSKAWEQQLKLLSDPCSPLSLFTFLLHSLPPKMP